MGHSTQNEDNLYLGQLPKRIVIGMVEDDAFSGLCTINPYNFKSVDLRSIILSANGVAVPGTPLKIEDGDTAVYYQTLFYGLHKLEQERGSIITREDWSRGYAFLALDLTSDFNHGDHYCLVDHGKIKLELEFSNKLTHIINILILSQFDVIETGRNILFLITLEW